MKPARGSQFGGRIDDTGHDHGNDEIALPAGRGVEDGLQVKVAQTTENCGDMAVRKGSGDEEGILQGRRRRRSQRACQGRAEGGDLMGGEMSDVGNGASLDFAVVAIRFAEEDGIFVYTRSQRSRLFEFDQKGNYVREIGEGLYGFVFDMMFSLQRNGRSEEHT